MPLLSTLAFIANHPLSRGRRTRALVNYFKWQVTGRLMPGQLIHPWVNGSRIIVRPGETGVTGNLYCGLHDFADMGYLLHILTPEDTFVDVGANSGAYTILACAAKGAKGICFEPVPATFERLVDNLRINDLLGRVEANNIGVSDEEGELAFTCGEDTTNHIVAADEQASSVIRVSVRPLDSLLKDAAPSLLKIDVEGFESRVLAGARQVLGRPSLHTVIMELNGSGRRYGVDDGEIIGHMSEFGFSTFGYDPYTRQLTAVSANDCRSGNTLFIRDAGAIRMRLARAPRISVGSVWL